MNCSQARDTALLRDSGEATPAEADQLEEHLAACPDCRTTVTEELATLKQFRDHNVTPALPEHLRSKVLNAASNARTAEQKQSLKREGLRIISFTIRTSLAAAATVLLVFGLFLANAEKPAPPLVQIAPNIPEDISIPENITAALESAAMTRAAVSELDDFDILLGMLASPSPQTAAQDTDTGNISVAEEAQEIMNMMDNFTDELSLIGGIS